MKTHKEWRPEEDLVIIENKELTSNELTILLPDRTVKAIACRRTLLNVKKTVGGNLKDKDRSFIINDMYVSRHGMNLVTGHYDYKPY